MKNIILQFIKNSINLANYSDFFSLVSFFNDNINTVGIEILKLILEEHDLKIKNFFARKRAWDIVRINTRTIFTPLGKLTFKHTYYRNKRTKKYAYLLDQALNIPKYQRLETVLQSKILEFTNYLSFENTGKLVCDSEIFTKQTVKKILDKYAHADIKVKTPQKKREVEYLYIEADEDHVALQHDDKRSVLNKLIYVHEGKVRESSKRNYLKNKYIFASNQKKSDDLWIDVYDYLDRTYNLDKIKQIFILGDGARWIKTSLDWIDRATYTLDSFHLNKAILIASGGKNNKDDYEYLKKLVYSKAKDTFGRSALQMIEKETNEKKKTRRLEILGYIKNQWEGIENFLDNREKHSLGCSAEGHVSHILASRMSSRPFGWSRTGLENITKLRVNLLNGATRKELADDLRRAERKIALEKKEIVENIERIKKVPRVTVENIPVLNIGQVNSVFCMMKGLRDSSKTVY